MKLVNKESDATVLVKRKKIRSVVTIDGLFYEGKCRVMNQGIIIDNTSIPFENIGILEAKKGSFKKVASFPLKTIGLITGVAGLLMTTAYVSEEAEEDPALGIAGITLLGFGLGSTLLGSKVSTEAKSATLRSYHVKDWHFVGWQ